MPEQDYRLNDGQMARFIAHGHVTVTPDLPAEFHQEVFDRHQEVFDSEGNPGNNLLPRIPQVRRVFDDPAVVGALQSVVGGDYYLQPHRHPHFNQAGSKGQGMHQDGGKRWSHRTRYLLAFYYPQDTPLERGPSGIVPGSHYFNTPAGARHDQETPLVTPAGTVTVVDYDLWHRAMPNTSEHNRFMIKFLFARMSEPRAPSWDNRTDDWPGVGPALPGDGEDLQAMYAHVWHWHRGLSGSGTLPPANGRAPADLARALRSEDERQGIAAAYALAAFGAEAVPLALAVLEDASEMGRRHAAYALSAIGRDAVEGLAGALHHAEAEVRADAATILGDIGLAAAPAVPALIEATRDPEDAVRQRGAEALGTTAQAGAEAAPALTDRLADGHGPTRSAAVMALARLGPHAAEAVEALETVLDDGNRYVRADALFALQRIGTPLAKDTLISHLMPARWCPLTSPASTF